ncbi:hypothetical protein [Phytopseudomonas dryadis]|uniref:Uncharacterized protein n=1 Tax=Phytopseudomonas dryadis TaxID=2487520 RepID=A0ABY1ZAZ8_9GAMM|nr:MULTISPECIES: hypothetical protein [Pseudomonas]TBV08935.1 hypothetical protein DNK34_03120 [Pseudomonas dryadis]TBV15120.1 hypothetical protein DNK41_18680 [Pseudomonas sp. FRB 230]
MSTITATGTPVGRSLVIARTASEAGAASGSAREAGKQAPSVTLSLSAYTQKRMASMREATAKLRASQDIQQQARKEAARQRLEDIKQRIAMLKQLAAGLGPDAAKGMLRQIKQLAQELGQVAAVLKAPSASASASMPDAAGTGAGVADGEVPVAVDADPVESPPPTSAAVADEPADEAGMVAAEDESREADEQDEQDEEAWNGPMRSPTNEQRRTDAEALKKVARQLKQLLAMVKAQLGDAPDAESRTIIGEIKARLDACEQAASAMGGGGLSPAAIGATLSISV